MNHRFREFLDGTYATLVVRLHHSEPFQQDQLWRYAADFKTNTGMELGAKPTRRAPGVGELEVYFDPAVAMAEKISSANQSKERPLVGEVISTVALADQLSQAFNVSGLGVDTDNRQQVRSLSS